MYYVYAMGQIIATRKWTIADEIFKAWRNIIIIIKIGIEIPANNAFTLTVMISPRPKCPPANLYTVQLVQAS